MNINLQIISKFMSLILRHEPDKLGIGLDENGWTTTEELVSKLEIKFPGFTLGNLEQIVADNDKKRFEFNSDKSKIRASQGHSIKVDLGYEVTQPPEILFHGTSISSLSSILKTGINKGNRHHVHLTEFPETALKVGSRYGIPVIIKVDSKKMFEDGIQFYKSTNDVWLTEFVDPKYIEEEK